MIQDGQLLNYVGGIWKRSRASEFLEVRNPATAETMVRVPLSSRDEVDEAVRAAQAAFAGWRRTPPVECIQYLFKSNRLLEANFAGIALRTTPGSRNKPPASRGQLQPGRENVAVATGVPSLIV